MVLSLANNANRPLLTGLPLFLLSDTVAPLENPRCKPGLWGSMKLKQDRLIRAKKTEPDILVQVLLSFYCHTLQMDKAGITYSNNLTQQHSSFVNGRGGGFWP